MAVIGALVAAAASIGAAIYGGIKSASEAKKRKEAINKRLRENEDWYNRRYNEDATQRADAQRLLTLTQESIRSRNRAAAGTQAVMGGTDESAAVEKEANNKALADAVSQIAAQSDSRKEAIEQKYKDDKAAYEDAKNNISVQKSQAIAQAVQGVGQAAGSIADAFSKNSTTQN